MERAIIWAVLVFGWIVWLCGMLLARPGAGAGRHRVSPAVLLGMGVVPVVVFLATLPSHPPFAAGHGFGLPFLIGGLLSLLAFWTVLTGEERRAVPLHVIPIGLGIVAGCVPLLFPGSVLIDAMLGVQIGWLCVAATGLIGLPQDRSETGDEVEGSDARATALVSGLLFLVAFGSLMALGRYRGYSVFSRMYPDMSWSIGGMLLVVLAPLTVLLHAGPSWIPGWLTQRLPLRHLVLRMVGAVSDTGEMRQYLEAWGRGVISGGLLLLLASGLIWKFAMPAGMLQALAAGVGAALLTGMLIGPDERDPVRSIGLSFLVAVAGLMVAYQVLAGYGVALFGVAFTTTGCVCLATSSGMVSGQESRDVAALRVVRARYLLVLVFVCVTMLYRFFSSRYSADLKGVALTDQYAFFGIIAGMLVPPLLATAVNPGAHPSPAERWLRLMGAGALCLLVPGIAVLLWGAKITLALLTGLSLATIVLPIDRADVRMVTERTVLSAVVIVAIALAMIQWSGHVFPHVELARAIKVKVVAWASLGMILVLLFSRLISWGVERRVAHRAGSEATP
ncbi:MAG: hypothetical protein RMJ43_10680 [Chloroherpetonaceae bacterium]|nr:hypothetical protein [Chthonomonadaceae bacterium]MDW8208295.1 hypothetical protein [Chloroherpetonaceae bacterium]